MLRGRGSSYGTIMTDSEEKYGQKIEYDPLWKGPMQNIRFPTDRIWLITFIIYLVIYISAAIYGLTAGDLSTLGAPTDDAGRSCGLDAEVKDKPYLLYIDLKSCLDQTTCKSPSVCVSQCPTENFIINSGSKTEPLDEIKKKIFCTSDINVDSISTFSQLDTLLDHKKCTKWYLISEALNDRCLAFNAWIGHENETISSDELYKARAAIKEQDYVLNKIYKDTSSVMNIAIVAIICGGLIALFYVLLLRWFAVPFFYASICMLCSIMVYGIYNFSVQYAKSRDNNSLFTLIVLVLLIVGVIIAVIYFRKKIYLACQLVKESSKAVLHLSTTLIFPILPCLLYVIVVVFSAVVLLSLITITKPNYQIIDLSDNNSEGCKCEDNIQMPLINGTYHVSSTACDPIVFNNKCKAPNGESCLLMQCRLVSKINPGYLYAFHSINLVGFYWLIFFISGFEYMVLGGAFATWYWTFNKNNVSNYALVESTSRTVRFHLGTIAIGSLILTIVQIVRMILNALHSKVRETNNAIAMALMCCLKFLFDLLDSLLNFLNYNAYLMCAIHGKSFCQSAKSAFNLIMRNVVKVIVVDTVADWLFVMAKLLVTSITVGGVMLYMNYTHPENAGPLSAAVILTAIGTFIIASVFFKVQSIAVQTIFLCFIEDSERNDGSEGRPYYMSKKLRQMLHK